MLATPELEIARNLPPANCAPAEAERYTRWLATHHYENFNVVSCLLPRRLHQEFYNLYAYCRWSDDLGDEVADPARAMQLLDAWEEELRLIYAQDHGPSHPVLIALAETIRAKIFQFGLSAICCARFARIKQFSVIGHGTKFWSIACIRRIQSAGWFCISAAIGTKPGKNSRIPPVLLCSWRISGRTFRATCEKGRIYIPLEALAEHGLSEADIVNKRFDARYVALMKSLIDRTRALFHAGLPLAKTVAPFLRVDLEMFSRGGLAILDAIEVSGYNTLQHRPTLTKWTQMSLLGRRSLPCRFRAGPALRRRRSRK